jgi:two-component system sensor histidine kinase CreC
MAIVLLGTVIYSWITIPIEKLTRYANAVRDGRRVQLPALGKSEIGQLGAAFEEMRDALEGKEYVSEYVQTLTHEMKSPLSAIRGAAELLDEDMPSEQRIRFLENIRTESGRIQDLVDRLLQLSALEKRKGLADIEEIDMTMLLQNVVESMTPVFSAKDISVEVSESKPAIIKGEPFLVRQVLSNLLQNAVDFSPHGSSITVSMKTSDESVEITISDEGTGIPDYALDKVFDRFYSLKRPESGKKSSGLGLTLVREATTLHGGRIKLENNPQGGARAILHFPIIDRKLL